MIKNYLNFSLEEKTNLDLKPKKQTISFLLNYSKSFDIEKNCTMIKNIRLDKN